MEHILGVESILGGFSLTFWDSLIYCDKMNFARHNGIVPIVFSSSSSTHALMSIYSYQHVPFLLVTILFTIYNILNESWHAYNVIFILLISFLVFVSWFFFVKRTVIFMLCGTWHLLQIINGISNLLRTKHNVGVFYHMKWAFHEHGIHYKFHRVLLRSNKLIATCLLLRF